MLSCTDCLGKSNSRALHLTKEQEWDLQGFPQLYVAEVSKQKKLTKFLILGRPANAVPSSALLHVDLYESDYRRCCIALSPSKGLTKSGVVLLLAPLGCFCGRFFFLQSQASHVTYLGSNSELRFIQRQCQELGLGRALKREPRGFAFLFSDTFWQERLSDGVPHDPLRGYFVARFDSACPLDSR